MAEPYPITPETKATAVFLEEKSQGLHPRNLSDEHQARVNVLREEAQLQEVSSPFIILSFILIVFCISDQP